MILGEKEITQVKIDGIVRGYTTIEKFLENSNYLVGDNLTLADLSLWPQLESIMQLIPMEAEKYPKVHAWLARLRQLPYSDELNRKGADMHIEIVNACFKQNNS